MRRLLIAAMVGLFGATALAAEGDVTLVITGLAKPPEVKKLPDGSFQITIPAAKLSTASAAGAAADAAAKPGGTSPKIAAAAPEGKASEADGGQPNPFLAQQIKGVQDKLNEKGAAAVADYKNYLVDMSIPTTPAFSVLGATPETILQPKAPRDLAVSLVQGLSDKEKLGKGVGFDIAPYMLAFGAKTTLKTYKENLDVRVLSNAQLSFGAIKQDVTGGGNITRLSGGASFIFFDDGDPRLSEALSICFNKAVKNELTINSADGVAWVQETLNEQQKSDKTADGEAAGGSVAKKVGPKPGPLMIAATRRLSDAYDDCRTKFKTATWNSTRWTAGLAQAVHNRGGGTHKGAAGLWTTYSLNLDGDDMGKDLAEMAKENRSQALFHYRRTNREEVASTTDARGFELRRGDLLGIGYKYGSDKRNVSAEFSVQHAKFDTGGSETSRKLALGGELMVSKDLWLVLTIGGQGGQKNGNNSPFALAGLKFGSASESTGAFGK